jgi:hypothetical protein
MTRQYYDQIPTFMIRGNSHTTREFNQSSSKNPFDTTGSYAIPYIRVQDLRVPEPVPVHDADAWEHFNCSDVDDWRLVA